MTLNLSMVQLYLPSQKILQLWSSFIARAPSVSRGSDFLSADEDFIAAIVLDNR